VTFIATLEIPALKIRGSFGKNWDDPRAGADRDTPGHRTAEITGRQKISGNVCVPVRLLFRPAPKAEIRKYSSTCTWRRISEIGVGRPVTFGAHV